MHSQKHEVHLSKPERKKLLAIVCKVGRLITYYDECHGGGIQSFDRLLKCGGDCFVQIQRLVLAHNMRICDGGRSFLPRAPTIFYL
jgi:hypothetical protein